MGQAGKRVCNDLASVSPAHKMNRFYLMSINDTKMFAKLKKINKIRLRRKDAEDIGKDRSKEDQ